MQLKFLCECQRQQLKGCPNQAEAMFERAMARSLAAVRSGQGQHAFDCAGVALEAVHIYVSCHHRYHAVDLSRYADAVILMREVLKINGLHCLLSDFLAAVKTEVSRYLEAGCPRASIDCVLSRLSQQDEAFRQMNLATLDAYASAQASNFSVVH